MHDQTIDAHVPQARSYGYSFVAYIPDLPWPTAHIHGKGLGYHNPPDTPLVQAADNVPADSGELISDTMGFIVSRVTRWTSQVFSVHHSDQGNDTPGSRIYPEDAFSFTGQAFLGNIHKAGIISAGVQAKLP
jgi:hypothetical protein